MEIESILKELKFNRGAFPRQTLAETVARRDAVTPELLKIIKDARENAEGLLDQGAYMAHLYAMFLLAQFREPQAAHVQTVAAIQAQAALGCYSVAC